MEITSLAAFATVSVLLVLVPGADWAYAIAAGFRERSVVPAVGGLLLGYVTATCVVAAGLAALVASRPAVLTGLTVVGAGYLLWLGVETVARPAQPTAGSAAERSPKRVLLKGAGISGLNPKGFLLFLALLPQFIGGSWPVAIQIGTLGLLHVVICGVVYSGVATAARAVLRTRPAVARGVTRGSGVAMILIAAGLLVERLH
ncbi:LysE family translocator [Kribbella catacumbae]|uniref:LysE family translocator n=1 Tax=Kribbella catacumbae TaxID=460086 RepID=UPI00037D10B4|nr:LysE family translocator [Kribbella catacumbae]